MSFAFARPITTTDFQKPPWPFRINRNRPLAHGLAAAWVPDIGGGLLVDLGQHAMHMAMALSSSTYPLWNTHAPGIVTTHDNDGYFTVADNDIIDGWFTGTYTLEFWIRSVSTTTVRRLFGKSTGIISVIFNYPSAGVLRYFTGSAVDAGALTSATTDLNNGSWRQICLSRDGNASPVKQYIHVDGKADASRDEATAPSANANALFIGAMGSGTGLFTGQIASVRLWTRLLQDQEIASLYVDPWSMYRERLTYKFYSLPIVSVGRTYVMMLD